MNSRTFSALIYAHLFNYHINHFYHIAFVERITRFEFLWFINEPTLWCYIFNSGFQKLANRGIVSFSPRTPYIITDACILHAHGFTYLAIITGEVGATHFRIYLLGRGSVALCVKGGTECTGHTITCIHVWALYTCAYTRMLNMIPYMELVRAAWCIPGYWEYTSQYTS